MPRATATSPPIRLGTISSLPMPDDTGTGAGEDASGCAVMFVPSRRDDCGRSESAAGNAADRAGNEGDAVVLGGAGRQVEHRGLGGRRDRGVRIVLHGTYLAAVLQDDPPGLDLDAVHHGGGLV